MPFSAPAICSCRSSCSFNVNVSRHVKAVPPSTDHSAKVVIPQREVPAGAAAMCLGRNTQLYCHVPSFPERQRAFGTFPACRCNARERRILCSLCADSFIAWTAIWSLPGAQWQNARFVMVFPYLAFATQPKSPSVPSEGPLRLRDDNLCRTTLVEYERYPIIPTPCRPCDNEIHTCAVRDFPCFEGTVPVPGPLPRSRPSPALSPALSYSLSPRPPRLTSLSPDWPSCEVAGFMTAATQPFIPVTCESPSPVHPFVCLATSQHPHSDPSP